VGLQPALRLKGEHRTAGSLAVQLGFENKPAKPTAVCVCVSAAARLPQVCPS